MWDQINKLVKHLPDESEHEFLYRLLMLNKPQVCLEIGLGSALTYIIRATEQYEAWVIGINSHPKLRCAYRNNYYFIQGMPTAQSSWNKLYSFCSEIGKIDMVYQNDSSLREWELYSQLLSKNAVWIVDNPESEYFESLSGDKRLYRNGISCHGIVLLN